MNHALLAKWNRHVACGDVLLLTSRGAEAVAIKTYQSTKRGELAKYTHVAVVIGPDEVVDAMPPGGVGFRRWAEMEAHYDLEQCSVARNVQLASNPEAWRLLYQRATFYYKQPYRLQQVFSPAEKVVDQSGLVCSQFVALLLSDVSINASGRPVLETLPIDIDRATRSSGGWRQFPLLEYGMCSKCHPSENGGEYTKDVLRAFPIELSPEQEQAARTLAEKITGSERGFEEFMSSGDELLAKSKALDGQSHDLVRTVRDEQYEASSVLQEFDDLMTHQMQRLASQQIGEDELSVPAAELSTLALLPIEGHACSGSNLLSVWRSFFIDYEKHDPIFMHGERRAANRVESCAAFRKQLEQIDGITAVQGTLFEKLATQLGQLQTLVKRGGLTRELIRSMLDMCEQLQRGLEPFCGESQQEVQKRIDGYKTLIDELKEWLRSRDVDSRIGEDAKKCLLTIQHLDFERLACLARQSALATVVKQFRSADEADCAQDVASPKPAKQGD